MTVDLSALRRDVQAFSSELAREWYLLGSGQKDEIHLRPIYARYAHLAHPAVLAEVRAGRLAPDAVSRRRAAHLYEFLVGFLEGMRVQALQEQLERARACLQVQAGDRQISYRQAQAMLAAESDRARRQELSRQLQEATRHHLNPLAEEQTLVSHQVARELGYADYVACWEDARGVDLTGLLPLADRLLAETRGLARAALSADLDRYLGLTLAEAQTHDYAYLNRAPQFDAAFPGSGLLPLLRRLTQTWGIDLESLPNIGLDLEPREKKSHRAFCATIRVPEEVVLVLLPRGGEDDYHSLLHEAGHALHFGLVQPGTAFEFARLGDMSVSELYAFLLQHLMHNPDFLAEQLGMAPPLIHEYVRFSLRKKLLLVRRYCAKLRYELHLHRTDVLPPLAEVYHRELMHATFLPYSPAYYLTDLDAGLYSAQYLRAWIAEAQFQQQLSWRFGHNWWANRAAGEFLRGLWGKGMQYTTAEVLQQMGARGLDLNPLLQEFQTYLG